MRRIVQLWANRDAAPEVGESDEIGRDLPQDFWSQTPQARYATLLGSNPREAAELFGRAVPRRSHGMTARNAIAPEAIVAFLRQLPADVEALDLSDQNIAAAGAETTEAVIAELRRFTRLRRIDLSGNALGQQPESAVALLQYLSGFEGLKHLNLGANGLAPSAITEHFDLPGVESLSLAGNRLDADALTRIRTNATLVDLRDNCLMQIAPDALEADVDRALQDFLPNRLLGVPVPEAALLALRDAATAWGCDMRDATSQSAYEALQSELAEEPEAAGGGILPARYAEAVGRFRETLRDQRAGTTLCHWVQATGPNQLRLAGNALSDAALLHLAPAFERLQGIDLARNELSDASVSTIADAATQATIVDLSDNPFSTAGAQTLGERLCQSKGPLLYLDIENEEDAADCWPEGFMQDDDTNRWLRESLAGQCLDPDSIGLGLA